MSGLVVLFLVIGMVLLAVSTVFGFVETRAVTEMATWPFALGLPVVRFRTEVPVPHSREIRSHLTESAEARLLSSSRCLFVPQEWNGHLSWVWYPHNETPYDPKGVASSVGGGTEVVGRLSVSASLGLPGWALFVASAGAGVLEANAVAGAVIILVGLLVPAFVTALQLPKAVARFRGTWHEVSLWLEDQTLKHTA